MSEMTKREREIYDARASYEAWCYAQNILEPWLAIMRQLGSDELTRVMERALDEVVDEHSRALDRLESLVGEGKS